MMSRNSVELLAARIQLDRRNSVIQLSFVVKFCEEQTPFVCSYPGCLTTRACDVVFVLINVSKRKVYEIYASVFY